MRRGRTRLREDEQAVSVVIGAILIVGIMVIAAITVQTQYVPVWDKKREYEHALLVQSQFAALRSEVDRQVLNPSLLVVSNPLSMAGSTTGALGVSKPGDRIVFAPAGQGISVQSPRLTVQVSNGNLAAGANESWTAVTSGGITVTDVRSVLSFRLRLNSAGRPNDTQSLTVTLTDGNDQFAGDFRVLVDDLNGNDWDLNRRTRNRDAETIFDNPIKFHNNAEVAPYWIDLIETELTFDAVLAAAVPPIRIDLVKNGLGGDFAITYAQNSGNVIVGSSGQVIQPFVRSIPGGSLVYTANNVRWPTQTYAMENGAVIVSQPEGAAFLIEPSITAIPFTQSSSTLYLSTPSGTTVGDLMIAQVSARGGSTQTISAPSGWTLLRRDNSGSDLAQALYYKVATATEGGSHIFGLSSNLKAAGGILSYSGIDTSSPIDAHAGQSNAAGTSVTAPSVTTTQANDLVVSFFGTATGSTFAAPGGMTERYDAAPAGSASSTAAAADVVQSGAGATGTKTATAGASAVNIGQTVALRSLTTAYLQQANAGGGSGTSNSRSINRPPGTLSGDLMVAAISVRGGTGSTISAPAGWNSLRRDDSGTTFSTEIFYRIAGTGEPGSYTWSFSSNVKNVGAILTFDNPDPGSPIDIHNGQVNAASLLVVGPSVTTVTPNNILVGFYSIAEFDTFTPPLSMTERTDIRSTTSNAVALEAATETLPTPGATGTRTATAAAASGVNIGQHVAVRAAFHLRAAASGTTDTAVATSVSISIPSLVGGAVQFSGDQSITVQTSARRGLDLQGVTATFYLNITTAYPTLWGGFFRQTFARLQGFVEGSQYVVDDSTAGIVRLTVIGVSSQSSVDDLHVILRQSDVTITIRG